MEMLTEALNEAAVVLTCWCLMDNHGHLVVKGSLPHISQGVKVASIKYSGYYNRVNRRVGPVFGDRFKSECIEDDRYLLAVVRYIHGNPVKAKICKSHGDYSWSSYREYTERASFINASEREFVLGLVGRGGEGFEAFHLIEDKGIFLEIKEDIIQHRESQCQGLIEEFFRTNGIVDRQELLNRPEWVQELSVILLQRTGLPIRKVAETLGISSSRVHLAGQKCSEENKKNRPLCFEGVGGMEIRND